MNRLDDHMGLVYEEAFRNHRLASAGELGERVVAVGPWWRADGQDQMDAVVLAEPNQTRVPVLVGEAKWTKRVDAVRIKMGLAQKAANVTDRPADLRYAVCARDEVVGADRDTLAITAADIFAPDI